MAKTVSALLPFLVVILGHPGLGAVTAIADPSSCDVLTTAIASNQEAIQLLLQDASGGAQRAEELRSLKDGFQLLRNEVAEYHKGECPRQWYPHGASCYFYDATQSTWEESRLFCYQRGGYLAKITSVVENFIVAGIVKHNAWIGLNDKEDEGNFVWTDGSKPVYLNWELGQPDGNEDENCVFMGIASNGKWHDNPCNARHGRLCEMSTRPY